MISLQQSLVQKENIYSSHIIPPTKLRIKIQSLCQEVSYTRYRKPEIWCIRLAYVPNIFFHHYIANVICVCVVCNVNWNFRYCLILFEFRIQQKLAQRTFKNREKRKNVFVKSLKKISNVKYYLWALWHFYFCKITIYIQFKTTMILLLKQ